MQENQPQDVLTSGTTVQRDSASKIWQAVAVMQDSSLNRRQTIRLGPGVTFAQIGVIGFDGQIELEALRLYGLPEDAPAVLYGCPSLPAGTRTLALQTGWDLPSLAPSATANVDVTVPGARRGDFADASLDTSSISFVRNCHVWSNKSVRVTARNVSASTVDLAAALLAVQVVKRRIPRPSSVVSRTHDGGAPRHGEHLSPPLATSLRSDRRPVWRLRRLRCRVPGRAPTPRRHG